MVIFLFPTPNNKSWGILESMGVARSSSLNVKLLNIIISYQLYFHNQSRQLTEMDRLKYSVLNIWMLSLSICCSLKGQSTGDGRDESFSWPCSKARAHSHWQFSSRKDGNLWSKHSKSCAQPGALHWYCVSTFLMFGWFFLSASLSSRLQWNGSYLSYRINIILKEERTLWLLWLK